MNALPCEPGGEEGAAPGGGAGAEHLLGSLATLLHGQDPSDDPAGNLVLLGRAHKVSVSLPEGLTTAVQQRVGKGEFSRYVTHAVAHQLQLDLLAELSAVLEDEHGPIPEKYLAEAENAWPGGE